MASIYRLLEKVFKTKFSKLIKLMIDNSSFVRMKTILLRTNNFLKSGESLELMILENNLGMIKIKYITYYVYRTVI